jgi:hypothetical protein
MDAADYGGGLRGNCVDAPFFKGGTCQRSCRKLSLGACCTKADSTAPVTCNTTRTLNECAFSGDDKYTVKKSFIGFAWNKTCAEAKCESRGACCSSDRGYDGGVVWMCSAGGTLLLINVSEEMVITTGLWGSLCKDSSAALA